MPLIKSSSDRALYKNISEMRSSGRPQAQAVAAGLDTQRMAKRSGLDTGGPVTGHLSHDGPGRTDDLPIAVPEGAYVIPADVVSALGQGNTAAGAKKLDAMFGPRPVTKGSTAAVDIVAAGGEYVISPEGVAKVGNGDLARGHDILDAFVKRTRAKTIQTLSGLPGPKK